jgi:hypothetical protein
MSLRLQLLLTIVLVVFATCNVVAAFKLDSTVPARQSTVAMTLRGDCSEEIREFARECAAK